MFKKAKGTNERLQLLLLHIITGFEHGLLMWGLCTLSVGQSTDRLWSPNVPVELIRQDGLVKILLGKGIFFHSFIESTP
jgi:hypothetical protein